MCFQESRTQSDKIQDFLCQQPSGEAALSAPPLYGRVRWSVFLRGGPPAEPSVTSPTDCDSTAPVCQPPPLLPVSPSFLWDCLSSPSPRPRPLRPHQPGPKRRSASPATGDTHDSRSIHVRSWSRPSLLVGARPHQTCRAHCSKLMTAPPHPAPSPPREVGRAPHQREWNSFSRLSADVPGETELRARRRVTPVIGVCLRGATSLICSVLTGISHA